MRPILMIIFTTNPKISLLPGSGCWIYVFFEKKKKQQSEYALVYGLGFWISNSSVIT